MGERFARSPDAWSRFFDGSDRIDAELIGRTARRVVTDQEHFAGHGEPSETSQHLKQLWHVLGPAGYPSADWPSPKLGKPVSSLTHQAVPLAAGQVPSRWRVVPSRLPWPDQAWHVGSPLCVEAQSRGLEENVDPLCVRLSRFSVQAVIRSVDQSPTVSSAVKSGSTFSAFLAHCSRLFRTVFALCGAGRQRETWVMSSL